MNTKEIWLVNFNPTIGAEISKTRPSVIVNDDSVGILPLRVIVPIRLSDIYKGYDLEACLAIVKALNEGETLKDVKEIIEEQGHSGMSFSLVSSMVKNFCDRGPDFVEYLNK